MYVQPYAGATSGTRFTSFTSDTKLPTSPLCLSLLTDLHAQGFRSFHQFRLTKIVTRRRFCNDGKERHDFHKMWVEGSWMDKRLFASQAELCFMESQLVRKSN